MGQGGGGCHGDPAMYSYNEVIWISQMSQYHRLTIDIIATVYSAGCAAFFIVTNVYVISNNDQEIMQRMQIAMI